MSEPFAKDERREASINSSRPAELDENDPTATEKAAGGDGTDGGATTLHEKAGKGEGGGQDTCPEGPELPGAPRDCAGKAPEEEETGCIASGDAVKKGTAVPRRRPSSAARICAGDGSGLGTPRYNPVWG